MKKNNKSVSRKKVFFLTSAISENTKSIAHYQGMRSQMLHMNVTRKLKSAGITSKEIQKHIRTAIENDRNK